MDGQECSEINLKSIDSLLLRLEAEYYQKKYLQMQENLKSYNLLREYSKKIECGPFGSNLLDTEYKESGILVVRPFNLKNCTIESDNLVYISQDTIRRNKLKICNNGTLLFSRVGDIKIGVSNRDTITISPNIIAVDFDNENLSKYLAIFFHTKYGFLQIERHLKVSAQPTISTGIVSELKIPYFEGLIPKIAAAFNLAEHLRQNASTYFQQAEHLLLSELGLKSFTTSTEAISIKSFSESFVSSSRLDAEYYQPKYDLLFEALKSFRCKPLGKIVTIKKSIEPGSNFYGDYGIPFVRVSDVTKFGMSKPEIKLPYDIVGDVSKLYPKKDTILLSKDGSVGIAYKVEEDLQIITSGALLHLDIIDKNAVLPDYLTLVLNSIVVQFQAERDASGAIIQHWKPSEIEAVTIPILGKEVQQRISQKVQESFALRRQSEQLLENAKRAVEIAIEDGEGKAISLLNEVSYE